MEIKSQKYPLKALPSLLERKETKKAEERKEECDCECKEEDDSDDDFDDDFDEDWADEENACKCGQKALKAAPIGAAVILPSILIFKKINGKR